MIPMAIRRPTVDRYRASGGVADTTNSWAVDAEDDRSCDEGASDSLLLMADDRYGLPRQNLDGPVVVVLVVGGAGSLWLSSQQRCHEMTGGDRTHPESLSSACKLIKSATVRATITHSRRLR